MTSPLSGSLASAIHSGMKALFLDATLTRDVPGVITDPSDPPAPTPTDYACKAILDNYTAFDRSGGQILAGDVKVLILANSVTIAPSPGNRATVQGKTFHIIDAVTDPATALWTCQGRQ